MIALAITSQENLKKTSGLKGSPIQAKILKVLLAIFNCLSCLVHCDNHFMTKAFHIRSLYLSSSFFIITFMSSIWLVNLAILPSLANLAILARFSQIHQAIKLVKFYSL